MEEKTKLCPRCEQEKTLDNYYAKGMCKECYKQRYKENKEHFAAYFQNNKQKLRKRENEARAEIRQKVQKLKEQNPCKDCGEKYPHYVMDFDHLPHLGKKVASIAYLTGHSSWKKVQEEIEKCELVCSNCHRKRTWARLDK